MFGNPAAERAAIEMTYTDTAVIQRPTDTTSGSLTRHELIAIYTGIPCALSFDGGDSSGQTPAQNKIDYYATVFMAPEPIVQAGDVITIARYGREYRFGVEGIPPRYATHQEVRVKEADIA